MYRHVSSSVKTIDVSLLRVTVCVQMQHQLGIATTTGNSLDAQLLAQLPDWVDRLTCTVSKPGVDPVKLGFYCRC